MWSVNFGDFKAAKDWVYFGSGAVAIIGIVVLSIMQIVHGNISSLYVMIVLAVFSVGNNDRLQTLMAGNNLLPKEQQAIMSWTFAALGCIEVIQANHSIRTRNYMGGVMAIFVALLFANLSWTQLRLPSQP